jgi:hypothetical protein
MELFDTTFNYSEIRSIDIVEIDHPMLGGIVSTQTLDEMQKGKLISRLKSLKKDGMYKCMDKYVVRFIRANDTLRAKVCGDKISNRNKDFYYSLPNKEPIIRDLIENANH